MEKLFNSPAHPLGIGIVYKVSCENFPAKVYGKIVEYLIGRVLIKEIKITRTAIEFLIDYPGPPETIDSIAEKLRLLGDELKVVEPQL